MNDSPLLQRARLIEHGLADALNATHALVEILSREEIDPTEGCRQFLRIGEVAKTFFQDYSAMCPAMQLLAIAADGKAHATKEESVHV